MKVVLTLFVVAFVASALCSELPQEVGTAVVQIQGLGAVEGRVFPEGRAFHAIPYAAPPVGDLRYAPTQPALPWNGTRDGKRFGPACPQKCSLPPLTCPLSGFSEDCLTIDVFTPSEGSDSSDARKAYPVMFFMHGGNYIQGGGGILYNGLYLANQTGVVVVDVQYRLGALSWIYSQQIGGNFGILDQQMALQWIQDHISDFGGDPNRVTIFGQSAGGSSVAAHMVSPASKPLFDRAIMESNPITLQLKEKWDAKQLSTNFATLLGCDLNDLDCLRQQSVDDILDAQDEAITINPLSLFQIFMPWQPVVDGTIIPEQPMNAFADGSYSNVPFMLGSVDMEALVFIYEAFPGPFPLKAYEALLLAVFGPHAEAVKSYYNPPRNQLDDTRVTLQRMGTDYIWACPFRNKTRQMEQNYPNTPVYIYHFDHIDSFDAWTGTMGQNETVPYAYELCAWRCCHGNELPFVFNTAKYGGFQWTSDEEILSKLVSNFWGNFATNSEPSPNGPVPTYINWPAYTAEKDEIMRLAAPSNVEVSYRAPNCDFFDSIGYDWGNKLPISDLPDIVREHLHYPTLRRQV